MLACTSATASPSPSPGTQLGAGSGEEGAARSSTCARSFTQRRLLQPCSRLFISKILLSLEISSARSNCGKLCRPTLVPDSELIELLIVNRYCVCGCDGDDWCCMCCLQRVCLYLCLSFCGLTCTNGCARRWSEMRSVRAAERPVVCFVWALDRIRCSEPTDQANMGTKRGMTWEDHAAECTSQCAPIEPRYGHCWPPTAVRQQAHPPARRPPCCD